MRRSAFRVRAKLGLNPSICIAAPGCIGFPVRLTCMFVDSEVVEPDRPLLAWPSDPAVARVGGGMLASCGMAAVGGTQITLFGVAADGHLVGKVATHNQAGPCAVINRASRCRPPGNGRRASGRSVYLCTSARGATVRFRRGQGRAPLLLIRKRPGSFYQSACVLQGLERLVLSWGTATMCGLVTNSRQLVSYSIFGNRKD